MKWIDVSNNCGGHNGEYDWKCSNCGDVDWQAHGVNPNKDGTQCRRCGSRPEAEKEVVKAPKDNGGPAFPTATQVEQNQATGETTIHQYLSDGMTLRDYFAAKALVGIYACPATVRDSSGTPFPEKITDVMIATLAYDIADAMLKARSTRPE